MTKLQLLWLTGFLLSSITNLFVPNTMWLYVVSTLACFLIMSQAYAHSGQGPWDLTRDLNVILDNL